MTEHLAAVHAQVARGPGRAGSSVHVEQLLEPSIRPDARRQDAPVLPAAELRLGFEHDGSGAVAEQDAGTAVVPVQDARERLRTDNDGALGLSGLDEIVGYVETEDEAGA